MKRIRAIAIALVCLYALAGVHELLPHDAHHGNGESCSLCVLLAAVALAVGGVVVARRFDVAARLVLVPVRPYSRTRRTPASLRGPPSSQF